VRVKFCAQNQPLNVNIDKVMIILRPDLGPAKKSPFGFFRSGLLDVKADTADTAVGIRERVQNTQSKRWAKSRDLD
jgi:hypothetical protein